MPEPGCVQGGALPRGHRDGGGQFQRAHREDDGAVPLPGQGLGRGLYEAVRHRLFLDLPPPFLDLSLPFLDLPPPFLDLPLPFLDLPPPFLDLPPPFIDLPPPFLDLPLPFPVCSTTFPPPLLDCPLNFHCLPSTLLCLSPTTHRPSAASRYGKGSKADRDVLATIKVSHRLQLQPLWIIPTAAVS